MTNEVREYRVPPNPVRDGIAHIAKQTGRDPGALTGHVVALRMRQSFRASGPERRRLLESALQVAATSAHRGI